MPASGVTASAATVPVESATWMRWSVDGWAGQPAAVTGGVVSDLTSMAGSSDDGSLLAAIELGGRPKQVLPFLER